MMYKEFRKRLAVLFFMLTLSVVGLSNNVKVGMVKVTDVTSGVATLTVDLSWENSWRDDFNWDAVYLFLKYKPASGEWAHVNLQNIQYTATNGYQVMNAKTGNSVVGVYVYPQSKMANPAVSTTVTLKWNCGSSYTKASFDDCLVFLLPQAIEMVYIPYGAYYLGDNYSNGSLCQSIIEVTDNIVKEGRYSASSEYSSSFSAENAVSGTSSCWRSTTTNTEEWWQIEFNEAKTIRYFGVGTYTQLSYGYLEGSNSGLNEDWVILWSGGNDCWPATSAYPLPTLLSVSNPGAYKYYRLRMKSSDYSGIHNVVMQEKELLKPAIIDTENAISLSLKGGDTVVNIPAIYPKGYKGFYIMKYEMSQKQYVAFLNTLKKEQQESLLGAAYLSGLIPGDYIFGERSRSSCRNGIILKSKPLLKAYVFGHDLNHNGIYDESDDGQCIACNYLSLNDLLAYASWAGLRPMSELEYERACRASFPQESQPGEYVWNTISGFTSATSLASAGEETESVSGNVNVNSGNGLTPGGPLRCGIFARPNSNQILAGATYWGVMEMGGNVGEITANIKNITLDKTLNGDGNFGSSTWSVLPEQYGIRGGSFATADSFVRISDRTQASGYFTSLSQRDSTVGFRLVRSLEDGIFQVNPGAIKMTGPLCPGKITTVSETTPAGISGETDLPFTYIWSVRIGSQREYSVIPGQTEKELNYSNFLPSLGYQFKRKSICALGEAEAISTGLSSYIATEITLQPEEQNAFCDITLEIAAVGTSLGYQWQQNGIDIQGATSVKYLKKPTTDADAGSYRCIVTGRCGAVISNEVNMVTTKELVAGTMVDPRDGQTYKTRIMPDGHEWMVEDLRFGTCNAVTFSTYQGGSIQGVIAPDYWGVCINSPVSGCGNLYNWQAIMNHKDAVYNTNGNPADNVEESSPNHWQGICPVGWHVPSGGNNGELLVLYNALCRDHDKFYPGTNVFAAILGGIGNGQSAARAGDFGYYGSSTSYSPTYIGYLDVGKTSSGVGSYVKSYGYAVRCIKDYDEEVN